MVRIGRAGMVLTMALAVSCGQKESECTTLVRPLKNLGKRLAEAQSVSGNENARPEQVAKAFRSLAKQAEGTAEALDHATFTSEELASIATQAAEAAASVAESAEQMARATAEMKGADVENRTARIQRTLANVAATNIERLCASRPAECEALSPLMLERPQLPPAIQDAEEATACSERTTAWLARLSALSVRTPELEQQIANLAQTSRAHATALAKLSASQAPSIVLTTLSKNLSRPIGSLGATLARAQELCKP